MARFASEKEEIITYGSATNNQVKYVLVRNARTKEPIGVVVDDSGSGPAKCWSLIYFDVKKERKTIGHLPVYINDNPEYTFHSMWE